MLIFDEQTARLRARLATRFRNQLACPPRRRGRQQSALLLATLAMAQLPIGAGSDPDKWNGGDGDWDVAASWSLGIVPDMTLDVVNDTGGSITHGSAIDDFVNSFLNSSSGNFIMSAGSLTVNTDYTNTGTGGLTVNGGVLNVLGNLTFSGGGATVLNGGNVNVNGNYSSNGDLTLSGGSLSGLVTGGAPASAFQVGGKVTLSSGTLSNFAIDVSQSAGFALHGGTIRNSDIQNSNLLQFDASNNVLDGVKLDGLLDLSHGGFVRLTNGTSFNNANPGAPLVFNIGSIAANNSSTTGAMLDFDDTRTLSNATITFGNSSWGGLYTGDWGNYLVIDGANALTIAHDTLIHGAAGNIAGNYYDSGNGTLDNHGKISFDAPASGYLLYGSDIGTGLATVSNESDGLIEVNSSAANNPNQWNQSLTINPGALNNLGTIQAVSTNGGRTSLYLSPTTYTNVGTVIANGVNTGIWLGGAGGYSNGTGITTAQLAGVSAINGGAVYLNTTLNNVGATFDPTAITGTGANAGQFGLDNGRILGGSVVNSILLKFSNNDNVLDGAALDGSLDLSQGGTVSLTDGTSFNNANPGAPLILNIGSTAINNASTTGATLVIGDTRTLSNAIVTFGNSYYGNAGSNNLSNELIIGSGNTLTLAHDTLIHGAAGSIIGIPFSRFHSGTLDNHGTISFDAPVWGSSYMVPTSVSNVGNGLSSVINESDGLIEVNNSPANNPNNFTQGLTIQPDALNNLGIIRAINTGTSQTALYIMPQTYTNVGTVIANGANTFVYLEGGVGHAGIDLTTAQSAGLSATNGGTLYLGVSLDNTGATFDPTAITGTGPNAGNLYLGGDSYLGSRILGGSITNSMLLRFSNEDNVLDGVKLDGSLDLSNNGRVHLLNGTSFNTANPGAPLILNIGSVASNIYNFYGATLEIGDTRTFSNATITFGNSSSSIGNSSASNSILIDGANTLTIAHDTLIHGAGGNIDGNYNDSSHGTLDNHGVISYDSPVSYNTYSASPYFGSFVGWQLSSVINESDGQIEVNNSVVNNPNNWNQILTIQPTTLNNLGAIRALNSSGGQTTLYITPKTYTNVGTVIASGANTVVYLEGGLGQAGIDLTTAQSAGLSATNGSTLYLGLSVDNAGATFDPTAIIGTGAHAGNLFLGGDNNSIGSRILGGSITNSMLLHFTNGDNVLDGVALDGSLDLSQGGRVHLLNETSFNNANPGATLILNLGSTFANNSSTNGGTLEIGDTRTFSNATITFGNSSYGPYSGNSLIIDGANTLTIAHDTLIHGASGAVQGNYQSANGNGTLDNHGIISFDAPSAGGIISGGTLGLYLNSLINESDGLIESNSNPVNNPNNWSQELSVQPDTLTNLGTIQAVSTNGGSANLYLAPQNYATVGAILANGAHSFVYLQGGGGYQSGTGFATAQSVGISAINGGTISLGTTLNNTGAPFDPTAITGTGPNAGNLILGNDSNYPYSGSRILGGSIIHSTLLRFSNEDNVLDDVALDGVLDLSHGGYVRLTNGTSFNNAFPGVPVFINIGGTQANNYSTNGGMLDFDDNRTLGFATITFGNSYYGAGYNYLVIDGSHTLTLAHNVLINGAFGDIQGYHYDYNPGYNSSYGTLDNHGVISFDTPAWNGGYNTSSAINSMAQVINESDGLIQVINTAANNPNNWNQTLTIAPTLLTNDGVIQAVSTTGGNGTIYLAPTNYGDIGTIIANGGHSFLYLEGGGGNTGTGFTTSQSAGISAINGGAIYLQTTLDNTGAIFDPTAITGVGPNSGHLFMGGSNGNNSPGSRILGGSVINTGLLRFSSGDNRLDGVQSFDAPLNLTNGGAAHLMGATDMAAFPANSTFTIDNGGQLGLDGTGTGNARTLDNVTISFGGNGQNRLTAEDTTTLTLGGNLKLTGQVGVIGGGLSEQFIYGYNTVINNTTISSETVGGHWYVDPYYLINNSIMQARNGAILTLASGWPSYTTTFLNNGNVIADGSSKTGVSSSVSVGDYILTNNGTLEAINSGTLNLDPYSYTAIGNMIANGVGSKLSLNSSNVSNITLNVGDSISSTNGGSVSLSANSITNNGALKAMQSGQIAINNAGSSAMTNSGVISVDNSSTMTVSAHGIQQSGAVATAVIDGALKLNGSDFNINGGTLKGTGNIYGNVTNAATVSPGDSAGTLNIQGNYTQAGSGLLDIALGGAHQGVSDNRLAVSNRISLAGLLDVTLVNGFMPTPGETFDFLTYGSRTGQFDTILSSDNGYAYAVTYNDLLGTATLVLTAAPAVPEMSTLGAMGLMLGAGWLAVRHRKQRAA
jgi:hypothetical protein